MMRVPSPPIALGAENTAPMTKPRPPITAQPTLKIDWNGLYCSYVMTVPLEPVEDARETGDPGGDAERVELRTRRR